MRDWRMVHALIEMSLLHWIQPLGLWFFKTTLEPIPIQRRLALIILLRWSVWWQLAMKLLVKGGLTSSRLTFTRCAALTNPTFCRAKASSFKRPKFQYSCGLIAEEWRCRSSRSCRWSKRSSHLWLWQFSLLQGTLHLTLYKD